MRARDGPHPAADADLERVERLEACLHGLVAVHLTVQLWLAVQSGAVQATKAEPDAAVATSATRAP